MRIDRAIASLLAATLAATMLSVPVSAKDSDRPFTWPPTAPFTTLAEDTREAPATAKAVRKGRRATGAVALTFDDGINRRACARIANILREHDAVGTFFINGQWLRKAPNQWRRILEGMEVANHTRSHPDLTREPHPVVKNQIRTNEWIHEAVLGRPLLKVLRPPYGAYGERIGRIAAQLGYETIAMWNVDTGDWRPQSKPATVTRRAIGGPPGSIILMHCSRNATVKALPRIIKHYRRRGLEIAPLSVVIKGARGVEEGAGAQRYDG